MLFFVNTYTETYIHFHHTMSVLDKKSNYSFINHGAFINELYAYVPENQTITSYKLSDKLFSIIKESKTKTNRKRSHESDVFHAETIAVRQMYEEFLLHFPTELKDTITIAKTIFNTSEVRDLARKRFESTVFDHGGLNGGNNSDEPLKCEVKGEYFLIPPKSRFFCGCVKDQCKKLSGSKFDILVADPPWWNKFIRRLKNANDKLSYSMMYNEDIASIPVQHILSNNCLVAVWCTNAPSNIDAVKNTIFPQWGVKYITTWYWLKVTVDLEPICPFGTGHRKQPYERLMLGSVGDVNVPESQLIVSVPSALHSHKPPLLEMLLPYINKANPQVLELFARYLLPNTTSVGYEPLKWQHISLYEKINYEEDNVTSVEGKIICKKDIVSYTVTGKEDKVTGKDNKRTGEENKVTGKDDKCTGEETKVTGKDDKCTGEENKVTGKDNKCTGEENKVTGKDNKCTGEENKVTGKDNKCTGEENEVTGDEGILSVVESEVTRDENKNR